MAADYTPTTADGMSEKERGMSDIREALVALLRQADHAPLSAHAPRDGSCQSCPWPLHEMPPEDIADAILAEFEVTGRWEDMWEYGVRWGDDGTVTNYVSRERAEERAAEPYGDKIVRRIAARTLPAGPWEEVPND